MIVGLYFCLSCLLVLALSFNVVKQRRIGRVAFGDGGYKPLIWARAGHSNALENIPIALLLLAMLELNHSSEWFIHALGCAFLMARLIHAKSILRGRCKGRAISMQITYAVLSILIIANLIVLPYKEIFSL